MFATTLLTIAFISSIVSAQDVPAWCQNLANPISDDNPRFQLVAINKTDSAESEGLALTRGEEGIVAQYPVATASSGSGNDGFGPFFTLQGGRLFAINDQSGEKASTNGPGLPTIPTLTFFTFDISTQNFCETDGLLAVNNEVDEWALCRSESVPGTPNLLTFNPTEEGAAGGTFIFNSCYPVDLGVVPT